MMTNALTALTLGDSLHVDGNHDGAIESYTAAICMTDSRRIVKQQQQQADADTAATTTQNNSNSNQAETKLIRFRSLSHRSESYLALSKYPHAYNDALAALALFPPSDIADSVNSATNDSTSTSTTSSLRPSEICLTRDRIARASFGLASQSMGIGGRSKSSGRVAFVKLSSPQMGDSGEMAEEAKEHWEGALALAGIMAAEEVDDDGEVNEKDGEDKKKKKKGGTAAEGRRLVERFRKSLKKLEGGDDSDDGEEEKKKEEEAKKEPSVNANPLSGMMDSMMGSKNKADKSSGDFNANLAGKLSSPAKASKPPPSSSSSSATTRSSSSSAPPPRKPSNHPASAHKTSPVTRGVMSGMPKYQYYQDDNFMKVQILEPNVKPENLTTIFTPDELSIKIKKTESNGKIEEYTVIYGDLYEEVDPSKCRAIIKSEKVLVKLKKKETKLEWQKLLDESKAGDRKKGRVEKRVADEGSSDGGGGGATTDGESKTDGSSSDNNNGNNGNNNNNNETIPTIDPKKNRPYASHRDWDAIDRNLAQAEAAEKPEGDEALNSLFAQIYKNANEDTKRAMVKSMQTSGGTCLSTNWDEVEKKDYEKEREAPKGMEWKDYEGRKLPMKEDED